MTIKIFFGFFPSRRMVSAGIACALFLTGPAAPWIEASSLHQNLWNERKEKQRLTLNRSQPLTPLFSSSDFPINKDLGFMTHTYHPFSTDGKHESDRANGVPFIVHFQEVHGNPAVQGNLAALLPEIARSFRPSNSTEPLLVAVEGAWGPLDTHEFQSIADAGYRDQLAQQFLHSGWITGEEFLSLTKSALTVRVVGVDDPSLFRENSRVREETGPVRREMGSLLGAYSTAFNKLESALLPPPLAHLSQWKEDVQNGRLPVDEYLRRLDTVTSSPWSREDFPSLGRLLNTASLERRPDIKEAQRRIEETLSQEATSSFDSRDINLLTSVVNQSKAVNPESALKDLNRLEDYLTREIILSLPLHRQPETNDFLRLKKWLQLHEHLASLLLSPDEWENIQTLGRQMDWGSFHRTLSHLADAHHVQLPPESIQEKLMRLAQSSQSRLLDFYRLANRRDQKMATQAVALARSEGDGFAALITGGFHSPGIRRWLRWAPANYVEISPRFTSPHTLRDASRFTLDSGRVPVSSLVAAVTLLNHPEKSAILKGPIAQSLKNPRLFELEGDRWLAGFARTPSGSIPFLLGGTEEKPRLIEGKEELSPFRASLLAQGLSTSHPAVEELTLLLSAHPTQEWLRSTLGRASAWTAQSARNLLARLSPYLPEGAMGRPSLLNGPFGDVFFGGIRPMLYFLPPESGSAGERTPSGDPLPEELMKTALAQVRKFAFSEAEQTLQRLRPVDLDDHWSGEFFRQLSVQERATAGGKLSPLAWGAALNGHFTRLSEDHTSFLIEQFKTATELDRLDPGRKVSALKEHLARAKITLAMFDMNTRSPATPGDADHATEALQHNQTQSIRTTEKTSWGWICSEMENLTLVSTLSPENERALRALLQTEKKWLALRLRNFAHASLSPKPEKSLWFVDDFLLPSIYGEYRQLTAQAPQTDRELRKRWESRRAASRGRTIGILTDLSGTTHQAGSATLRNFPSLSEPVKKAIQSLPQGEATVRIQHPWPQTKDPLEFSLADHLRRGNATNSPRKLWRINFGEIKRSMENENGFSSRLLTLLQILGEAGGSALVIDLDELATLFPREPDALARAVQNLRQIERETGISGPNQTPIFLIGSEESHDPLAALSGTSIPRLVIPGSPELIEALLKSRADDLFSRGVMCSSEILPHLKKAIEEGTIDFTMAEGLLERAGARARAAATSTSIQIKRTDLEEEWKGLPPFEQLSLWRQAGIALHSMASAVGTELQRNLNNLRRTSPTSGDHAPLMAFLRHFLALRFLWPLEAPPSSRDTRQTRSQEDQINVLNEWRIRRHHFRDELDRAITGQNDLKMELERTYLLHDFEQWANPSPLPADMVLMEGPPGTGKTTIGHALAKATGRKFIEINAGGTADPKRFKGLQRTFVGSQPSEITRQLEAAGTEEVLILIDEVDKMSRDSLDALTDFLDKRQEYHDTYLGSHLRYRRPRVRVILTANAIDQNVFPDHLLSRLKRTLTRRYTDKELLAIGLDHVFPETLRLTEFGENRVSVPDPSAVIHTIVSEYSPKNDVRDLQKMVRRVLSSAYHEWLLANPTGHPASPVIVDPDVVRRILGVALENIESVPRQNIVGQVNSLAANDSGGVVKPVQAYFRSLPAGEDAELIVTGLIHPDMKDSAQRAVLAVQQALGPDTVIHGRTHFHIPGEFQKSGPSAGLSFLTALYSEMTGWPVKARVAMTGEISPTGVAQRIGALDKKLSAALQAGVNTVFLPAGNAAELRDALARNEHLRGRVNDGDQSRLYISDIQWSLVSLPLPIHLAEQVSGGRWVLGIQADVDALIKTNPILTPPLTCVLVRHGFSVLNQALERPEGVPPLTIPPQPPVLRFPELVTEKAISPLPQVRETAGTQPLLKEGPGARVESIQGGETTDPIFLKSNPEERIAALRDLLSTGRPEDARRVLHVLHILASTGNSSFRQTVGALPPWIDTVSRAASGSDLQTVGVLVARTRETIFEDEFTHFRKTVSKPEWLETTPTNAGEIARTVRNALSSQLTITLKFRNQLQGDETRQAGFRYFNHVAVFLSQVLADLPPESSYAGGRSLTYEENELFKKSLRNYLDFMRHQLIDFPGQGGPIDRLRKDPELPFIGGLVDSIQENTLLQWMARTEQIQPTSDVAKGAMAILAENSLHRRLIKGDIIDHTLLLNQVQLTEKETQVFRLPSEEMARRLMTEDSRSAMFFSPDPAMATRFLSATAQYFQTRSPFPNQHAHRVLSVHFPNTPPDPITQTKNLKDIISDARAVGDVILAIDLDALARQFNDDISTPLSFLLNMAQTRAGPQGTMKSLPLLFYGKEETHLALSDTCLPYDRAVQSFPILPPQPGPFLTEWLLSQLNARVGHPVRLDSAAQRSLEGLLDREKDIDLTLVLSGLASLASSPGRQNPDPFTTSEVNRAIGESLVAAEREPETISEYRNAARRVPDPSARQRLLTEISRLARRSPGSSDYQMLVNWIKAILAWPWREKPLPQITPDQIPSLVKTATAKLDENIFGMAEIKKEIILHYELYLHQLSQGREPEMPIIALSGPPGTAKTLLARMIGDIFGLPSEVIACSGIDDSRHFVGFFRTYTASEEGAIVKAYRKTKTKRMVLVFDELDKRRTGGHFGDPLNALTRFFDPKHRRFTDDFLEQTLDVSQTLTIITLNRLETIPEHLQSRMIVLKVNAPTREEKIGMAGKILLPRLMKEKGFLTGTDGLGGSRSPVTIEQPLTLVSRLVDEHLAPRDDARKIEQTLNQLLDSAFSDYVDTGVPVLLTANTLEKYLGPSQRAKTIRRETNEPPETGRLTLPVQESALLTVHAVKRSGKGWKLQLPLALGDTGERSTLLAETARVAWEYALSSISQRFPLASPGTLYLHLDANDARLDQNGLGFAGFGILASLVSSMTDRALPPNVTFGGAIDLKGNVLPLDIKEQGALKGKILRAAGDGHQTFYLPAGKNTRQELNTTMRHHPFLRGLLIENGVAEFTLVGLPDPIDRGDSNESARSTKHEAALWNRLLESIPEKARSAGIQTSQDNIPLEEFLDLKEMGKEAATPFVGTVTLKGPADALIQFLSQNQPLRTALEKQDAPLRSDDDVSALYSPTRYVLVETVNEAFTDLFPTPNNTRLPPTQTGIGPTLKSVVLGLAAAVTLGGTMAPTPAPAAPRVDPPHRETSLFLNTGAPSPLPTLAALRLLGREEKPGSPLGRLAQQIQQNPSGSPETELANQVAEQMSTLDSPKHDSDISQTEWGSAWAAVSEFIKRRPRRSLSASSRRKGDPTQARPNDFYRTLESAVQSPLRKKSLVLVDWGMVASRPDEVAHLLTPLYAGRDTQPEIAFLDSEGNAEQMARDLETAGLSRWKTSHLVDRKVLEEAKAVTPEGQVDLASVDVFLQNVLRKEGLSPAPLTQVVVDPVNARRYRGDVIRLLLDVNEVVLQGDAAIQFLKTIGREATHPIRTPSLSYDPLTRTLRLQAQSIAPSALANFGRALLLIESQA